MDQQTIARYQAGGDIYAQLQSTYGTTSADAIAAAAATGDETQVNAAISNAKYGAPLDSSTWDILENQLATNPLGAPLDSLNNQLSTLVKNIFGNPYVLLLLAAAIFFFVFDGMKLLRGK